MYLGNYEQFVSTAKFWTESYAMTKEEVAALPEVRGKGLLVDCDSCMHASYGCIDGVSSER